MAWTREEAAHLLRRTGFGGSVSDVDALVPAGQLGAISKLLDFNATPDPVWDDPNPLGLLEPDTNNWDARRNLLYKLIVSKRPLQAHLLWFWHGHFTSDFETTNATLMLRQ